MLQLTLQLQPVHQIFGYFFGDAFFDYVLGSILHRFLEAPTLKIIDFTKEKQGFRDIYDFRTKA